MKRAADIFAGGDTANLKIHIIVHNAGLVDDHILEAETVEMIDSIFHVNGPCASASDDLATVTLTPHVVRGPFLITQALRPYMPSHDNARIIAVSSIAARMNVPGTSIYSGKYFFVC